jgi:hypothetical protein
MKIEQYIEALSFAVLVFQVPCPISALPFTLVNFERAECRSDGQF